MTFCFCNPAAQPNDLQTNPIIPITTSKVVKMQTMKSVARIKPRLGLVKRLAPVRLAQQKQTKILNDSVNSIRLDVEGQGAASFLIPRNLDNKPFQFNLSHSINADDKTDLCFSMHNDGTDDYVMFDGQRYDVDKEAIEDGETVSLVHFKAEEQWAWISVDQYHQIVKIGCGNINQASTLWTIQLGEEDFRLEKIDTIYVSNVSPLKAKTEWAPVVYDLPPVVKPQSVISLMDIQNKAAISIETLPAACQELYGMVSGEGITMEPMEVAAIEYSLRTPGCTLFKLLAGKRKHNEFDDPNQVYIRCTLGDHLGNSPGVPYVLEIWPSGCGSPIHNHSGASAIIKVLSGVLDVTWYDPVLAAGKLNDATGSNDKPRQIGNTTTFVKDQVTWMDDNLYGCHRLHNNGLMTCITIQCYQYPEEDRVHYEYFDFIEDTDDKLETKQFYPTSDIDFGDMMEVVKQELDDFEDNKPWLDYRKSQDGLSVVA